MKIGLAQFAPVIGEPETNRRTVARLAAEADGADLLVFPELSNAGYHFRSREEASEFAESAEDGPFVRLLMETAERRRMFLVAGLAERADGRIYNSAVLVGPRGRIGLYRKMHLFLNEKDIFEPGDLGFPVFDLDPRELGRETAWTETVRCGLLICFDWQFPEAWRVLALRGADVVCHPSNLVLPGKAQRAVPVQAMLNRVYAVLANRYGEERGLDFTGNSLVVAPSGEVLAEAPPEGDAVRVVAIDPLAARDKKVTARNDAMADRRPEFYGEIARPHA